MLLVENQYLHASCLIVQVDLQTLGSYAQITGKYGFIKIWVYKNKKKLNKPPDGRWQSLSRVQESHFFFSLLEPSSENQSADRLHVSYTHIDYWTPATNHTHAEQSKQKEAKEDRAVQTKVDSFFFSVNIKALS